MRNRGRDEPLLLDDATLANLDLSGVTPSQRVDGIDWSDTPATLTDESVEVFSSNEEGGPFDPVSIFADLDPFQAEPDSEPAKPLPIDSLGKVHIGRAVKMGRVFCLSGESPCRMISPGRTAIKGVANVRLVPTPPPS